MPLCSSLLLEVQPRQEIAGGCEYGVHRPLQGVRCAAIRILAYGDLWCVLRGAPNSVRNSPSFLPPSLSTGFFDAELYWWRSHWCFRHALEWCLEASGGFRHFLARVRVLRPGLFVLFYVFLFSSLPKFRGLVFFLDSPMAGTTRANLFLGSVSGPVESKEILTHISGSRK